jgi:hypothetical protein
VCVVVCTTQAAGRVKYTRTQKRGSGPGARCCAPHHVGELMRMALSSWPGILIAQSGLLPSVLCSMRLWSAASDLIERSGAAAVQYAAENDGVLVLMNAGDSFVLGCIASVFIRIVTHRVTHAIVCGRVVLGSRVAAMMNNVCPHMYFVPSLDAGSAPASLQQCAHHLAPTDPAAPDF